MNIKIGMTVYLKSDNKPYEVVGTILNRGKVSNVNLSNGKDDSFWASVNDIMLEAIVD
jgi:hypothetical protein